MGSQLINDNGLLTIKSSSSSINDRKRRINRGKAVEKYHKPCGKVDKKSGKLCGKPSTIKSELAEARADALIQIFQAPYCREYFLKCIYHLPSDYIDKAIDYSTRPGIISPVRYFNRITKVELSKQGL